MVHSDGFKTKQYGDMFLEVLQTLPDSLKGGGSISLAYKGTATPLPDDVDVDYMAILLLRGVVPFLNLQFEYNTDREMFLPRRATLDDKIFFPDHTLTARDRVIQGMVSKGTLHGNKPHQYTISLVGFGDNFTFEVLQDRMLNPLHERDYHLTDAELQPKTERQSCGGGGSGPARSLTLRPNYVVFVDYTSSSGRIAGDPAHDWLQDLKDKYQEKK